MTPGEAVRGFIPEGLLEDLELDLAQVLELGRNLTPVVRRLTEQLKHTE